MKMSDLLFWRNKEDAKAEEERKEKERQELKRREDAAARQLQAFQFQNDLMRRRWPQR